MSLDPLTREEVHRLLDKKATLADFRTWLRPVAWRLGDEAVRAESPLTRRVALYISEFNLGHRMEDELRRLLADEIATIHAEAAPSQRDRVIQTAAETIPAELRAEARTQRAAGFVTRPSQNRQTERRTTRVPRDLVRSR
jgi:hypothetical protein